MSTKVFAQYPNVTELDGRVYHIPAAPDSWVTWNLERKIRWLMANSSPAMGYWIASKELQRRATISRRARKRRAEQNQGQQRFL